MSGRPMKYPYTLSAKIAQFPFMFYYNHKNAWFFKYWIYGSIACLPIAWYFQKLSYSPENVKKWKEIDRKQFSSEMRH